MDGINNRSGGGKTGRKINEKREEALKKALEKAVNARNAAKTNAERALAQKRVDHLRLKLAKSETHWRR